MGGISIFFLAPSGRHRRGLRRYADGCTAAGRSFCNAKVPLDEVPSGSDTVSGEGRWPADDPRWPISCEACGAPFAADAPRQLFCEPIYARVDTGQEMTLGEAAKVPGACWEAPWLRRKGPDGRALVVVTPDGEWSVDGRASNCTLPDESTHRCWVRHGRPEDGTLHVDKAGHTCAAGAGSIAQPRYHGFLHHGHLTEC